LTTLSDLPDPNELIYCALTIGSDENFFAAYMSVEVCCFILFCFILFSYICYQNESVFFEYQIPESLSPTEVEFVYGPQYPKFIYLFSLILFLCFFFLFVYFFYSGRNVVSNIFPDPLYERVWLCSVLADMGTFLSYFFIANGTFKGYGMCNIFSFFLIIFLFIQF